uniref:ATP synthase complex subunit 8 n=1 Tax=Tragiscus dimidiatus TaxID=206935 RepID=A0A1X9HDQ7_9SCAR|nr:ATP synthase F0 subunit 8 [Tragiscus dimidiatus]
MPQMAPLNWLFLFFYFLLIFMIFNTLNYYSYIYPIKSMIIKTKKNFLSWKW